MGLIKCYRMQYKNKLTMKSILFVILSFVLSCEIVAQNKVETFVIVTIEKKTNGNLHPYQVDYWIISRDLWKEESKVAAVPAYLYGFSTTDYNECNQNGSLVLYNHTANEQFDFEPDYVRAQNKLLNMIKEYSRKVQTVNKKWKSGHKERITISITPINGVFCFCPMVHRDGRDMPEYAKKIGMPVANFSYDSSFWLSQEFKEMERFDYSEFEFVSLHKIPLF